MNNSSAPSSKSSASTSDPSASHSESPDYPPAAPASPAQASNTEIFSWSLYDFGISAFNTLIGTFIYAAFFTNVIAPNEILGTQLWGNAITISGLVVAFLAPLAGALADRSGYRKQVLLFCTVIFIIGAALLYFPEEGDIWMALLIFGVANTAFELCYVFYNAYLPDLVAPRRIGRISGYGWALGFAGGLGCMLIGYVFFVAPETAPFGLSQETGAHIRATNILAAAWIAVFSIPLFLTLPSTKKQPFHLKRLARSSVDSLKTTFTHIRQFKDIIRLLVARIFYNDGLLTIIAFGGIYAQGTFGFTMQEILLFGIVLNIAAGIGAFVFGFFDDMWGGKHTVLVSIVGLAAGTLVALFGQSDAALWTAGVIIGIFLGPNQAASRSLLGRFVPQNKKSEFFGFFAFSGKCTAFLGPFLFGTLTAVFASQRAGVSVVLLFLLIGGLLLLLVDEERGTARANRAVETPVDAGG